MSNLYYLQDSRSYTGDCLVFWGLGGSGYYSGLERCQQYSKEAAAQHNESRESDIPWPSDYIEQRSFRAVDCQLMQLEASDSITAGAMVYVQQTGDWNGNDVYWLSADGRSPNLDKAKAVTLEFAQEAFGINEQFKFWPAEFIDSIARRIVHRQDVSIKQALKGTGIKLARPAKPRRGTYRCEPCGRFLRLTDFYGTCPHCGANNY